jgi:hypothetical protein
MGGRAGEGVVAVDALEQFRTENRIPLFLKVL